MPNLKETLLAYYLDKSGEIIIATSPYTHDKSSKFTFQDAKIKEDKPANNAMFTAVFQVWGIEIGKDEE